MLLAFAIQCLLVGCQGREQSASAPSGIPNTPESTEQTSQNRFDCIPDASGDGWECTESDDAQNIP